MRRTIFTVAALLAMGAFLPSALGDTAENLVKYRQDVMKALGGHTAAIAKVVKGEVGFSGHVLTHARGIEATSKLVADVFPKGTAYKDYSENNRALDKIWEEPDKFKEAIEALSTQAAKFTEVAAAGDQQAIAAAFKDLGGSCGGCHKKYRHEEK